MIFSVTAMVVGTAVKNFFQLTALIVKALSADDVDGATDLFPSPSFGTSAKPIQSLAAPNMAMDYPPMKLQVGLVITMPSPLFPLYVEERTSEKLEEKCYSIGIYERTWDES